MKKKKTLGDYITVFIFILIFFGLGYVSQINIVLAYYFTISGKGLMANILIFCSTFMFYVMLFVGMAIGRSK